jgi:tetratricopeptide (TPR) repeat protein
MFLTIDDIDSAAHCLLKAVEMDGANADGYYYLGLLSAIDGRFEDAAELFGHALDIRPKDARALRDSALVYAAMGKLTGAAERIREARLHAADELQLKQLERRIKLAQLRRRIADILRRFGP